MRQETEVKLPILKNNDDIKMSDEEKGHEFSRLLDGSSDFGVDHASSGVIFSLLASKDRDFLISPTGTEVKVSDLKGKIIGIYFSANWYPPCRKFNQVLANVYEQVKHNDPGFEIVFVSSDENLDAFNNYYSCMPWLAIPFSDLEAKRALNRRFDVEGIPCLVILQPNSDKDDETIRDGVELIYRYGEQAYPFSKERLEELLKREKDRHEKQNLKDLLTSPDRDSLLSHTTTNQVPVASLIGKTVGLFFSAQWCVPGVKFTSKLVSIYQNIKQELAAKGNEDFEIVFISTDHDQNDFNTYFETMPWLALPFGDPIIKNLTKYFDIQGIPSLVILGPDGKTVTKHGRYFINLYQESAYPFTEARIELLIKQIDEEAKKLPKSKYHSGHRHELRLVSEGHGGGPFICCDCDEQGSGWAYLCIECGYEVHPKCIRAVEHEQVVESS